MPTTQQPHDADVPKNYKNQRFFNDSTCPSLPFSGSIFVFFAPWVKDRIWFGDSLALHGSIFSIFGRPKTPSKKQRFFGTAQNR